MIEDAPVTAAPFALPSVSGGLISLGDLTAAGSAVLLFVTEECPTCAMTLRRLSGTAQALAEAGVQVAAVFEDPLEVAARTARRAGFRALMR